MKYRIELVTANDVKEFTEVVRNVDADVRLEGKDEHGNHWELSAKSMLCTLLLGGHIQHRLLSPQDIDWNTIYCKCEKDIYPLISKLIKE